MFNFSSLVGYRADLGVVQVFSLVVDLFYLCQAILTLTNPRLRYILKGTRLNPAVLPYRSVYGFPADAAGVYSMGVMVKILTNARVRGDMHVY